MILCNMEIAFFFYTYFKVMLFGCFINFFREHTSFFTKLNTHIFQQIQVKNQIFSCLFGQILYQFLYFFISNMLLHTVRIFFKAVHSLIFFVKSVFSDIVGGQDCCLLPVMASTDAGIVFTKNNFFGNSSRKINFDSVQKTFLGIMNLMRESKSCGITAGHLTLQLQRGKTGIQHITNSVSAFVNTDVGYGILLISL